MLLKMEQQHSASLMSLNMNNMNTFQMNMNEPSSPASVVGAQQQDSVNGSNVTGVNTTTTGNTSNSVQPPHYTYPISNNPYGGHILNNNNNNSNNNNYNSNSSSGISPSIQQQQQPNPNQSTGPHQQQQQHSGSGGGGGGGVHPQPQQQSNNYLLYNFETQYLYPPGGGGYLDNSGSSQGYNVSHLSTGSGGSGSGANGGAGGGNGNNNTGGSQGGGNSNTVAGGNNGICEQTDIKYFFEELCPVCGDKVSGYHYGLLTCESCKGFFKRTVQNKKVYTCVAERTCHIDKTQRKRCPFCRFQKCLEVGMKLEAVRADRMRGGRNKFGPMYKRDRARKLQLMRQRQLALQALRNSDGSGQSQLSPTGYQQSPYSSMNIKQEIQIPQMSSLTSSPDSPPGPIAVALGQVSQNASSLGLGGSGGMSATGTCNPMVSAGSTGNTSSSGTSVQHVGNDSKMWFANSTTASPHSASPKTYNFDTGTNPTSTGDSDSITNASRQKSFNFPRVSPMIREFVQSVDDREWQSQLFQLLQSQSYNQCEVDLFELMCKVLDQNLFSQVDWARNTVFFKDLKVEDQMKLLQNSWSDMLVLDHLHQRIHNNLPDETTLHNGQKFDLLGLGLLGVPQLSEHFNEIQKKLQELKFDVGDYICMKFLLLLNPDARGITNRNTVREGYENVQAALLDYTLTCYPSVTEKFSKLVNLIPEIHLMASEGEDHLYMKHCAGNAPTQTLLMEMLHAKRK